VEGQLRIGMPQDACDGVQVGAGGEQQARGGVAQVMEAHAAWDGNGHQLAAALGKPGPLLAHAGGAEALRIVGVVFLALAPAADVAPSRDDSSTPQSARRSMSPTGVCSLSIFPSGPGKTSSLRDWSRARSR